MKSGRDRRNRERPVHRPSGMRLLPDALAPLALGAAVAVALSACATPTPTPTAPAGPAAPSPRSTPIESTGAPLTSGKSPAQPSLAPGAQGARPSARPASEQVPATAQAVTISMDLGGNQAGQTPPKPVTITDRARVSELKALINGLPLFPPGTFSCPAGFGDNLMLTFRADPRTPALAVVTVDFSGCDGVYLTINGKSQPALAGPGTDNGPRILKTAGLSWKIPAR
jgi:hypothetical protein